MPSFFPWRREGGRERYRADTKTETETMRFFLVAAVATVVLQRLLAPIAALLFTLILFSFAGEREKRKGCFFFSREQQVDSALAARPRSEVVLGPVREPPCARVLVHVRHIAVAFRDGLPVLWRGHALFLHVSSAIDQHRLRAR